jgi:CHAD domain-containing protein
MSAKVEPLARIAESNGRNPQQAIIDVGKTSQCQGTKSATLAMPRIRPGEPAAELIRAALRGAVARVQAADPEARRGEIEGIHRLRTSTRRLRSELRTVQDLVDPCWRVHLEGELKWLASMLGSVRDLDILTARLRDAVACRSQDGREKSQAADACPDLALRPLFDALADRHSRNSRELRDALQGERYRNLVAILEKSAGHLAVKDEAMEPCRATLPPLAAAAWRRLKKGARALKHSDPDSEFHEVRKRAKRARYTAELIAPALGRHIEKKAARFIRLTTKVQDILGEHQDAVVAGDEIERILAGHPHDEALVRVAEDLIETERRAAEAARDRFFDVWAKLDRKKSVRWLKAGQTTKT